MSLETRRIDLAEALTAALADHDIPVAPYQDAITAPFTGWLEIDQTDTEECTYGEVRITVECVILVATDRADFERMQDKLTIPLLIAITSVGGRGVTVQPRTESYNSTTFYSLSARFVTEAQIS